MSNETELEVDITNIPDEEVITIDNEETTTSETVMHTNKSNFKKLAKSNKEKDRKIAELEAKLVNQDNSDDDLDLEYEDEDDFDTSFEEEFEDETSKLKKLTKQAKNDFPWIEFDKALEYAKTQLSREKESNSFSTFNTKSSKAPVKKKITELTAEEVVNQNLSPEQFEAWSNSQTQSVNPFS